MDGGAHFPRRLERSAPAAAMLREVCEDRRRLRNEATSGFRQGFAGALSGPAKTPKEEEEHDAAAAIEAAKARCRGKWIRGDIDLNRFEQAWSAPDEDEEKTRAMRDGPPQG